MKLRKAILLPMLTALIAAASCPSLAADEVRRVGVLTPSAGILDKMKEILFPELARLGFAEGKNLQIERISGETEQLPLLAHQLASARPEVVIAVGAAAIRAVKNEASTTPIVGAFIGEDPITAGFAASLAHPGGTVTGIVMLAPELDAKRLVLLHELVPGSRRVAVLAVNSARDAPNIAAIKAAGERVGIEILPFYAPETSNFRAAFAAIHSAGAGALQIVSAPELFANAETLARLAIEAKLPTICEWGSMASQGCLVGYGPNFAELHRRVADYVARLLRGAAPGDLPIEGPTRFDFAVNMKTAKEIKLAVPPSIMVRADEVIE